MINSLCLNVRLGNMYYNKFNTYIMTIYLYITYMILYINIKHIIPKISVFHTKHFQKCICDSCKLPKCLTVKQD